MATFTDQLTKIRRIAILENKKAATVAGAFMEFKAWFETQSGYKIKVLRTDEGTEFAGEMGELLKNAGIEHEVTAAYTSKSNGVAERANRTIMDMVRPMLHASGLPLSLWGEAAHTACYLKNRMLTRGLPGITPYEAFTGRKPKVAHLRIFGSACHVHVPPKLRKKLDVRSRKGYLVGFCSDGEYPMYRVWIPQTDRVILARDAIINENEMYGGNGVDSSLFDKTPVVKRGRPRKEALIAPAPVPAIEGILVEDPAPAEDLIPEAPEISIPAPTRAPTPPAVEERPPTPAREPSPEPPASPAPPAAPAAPAPAPARAPPVPAPSRSRYGRERRAPDHYGGMAIAAHFAGGKDQDGATGKGTVASGEDITLEEEGGIRFIKERCAYDCLAKGPSKVVACGSSGYHGRVAGVAWNSACFDATLQKAELDFGFGQCRSRCASKSSNSRYTIPSKLVTPTGCLVRLCLLRPPPPAVEFFHGSAPSGIYPPIAKAVSI